MSTHQLRRLDQALIALIDERARLTQAGDGTLRARSPDDVLRRYDGPLSPDALRAVLAAIDVACGAAHGRAPDASAPGARCDEADQSPSARRPRADAACRDAGPDRITAGPRRDDR